MKQTKIFSFLMVLILLAGTLFAQTDKTTTGEVKKGAYVTQSFEGVANSATDICYLDLRGWKTVDSVVVSIAVENETDIDTVNFMRGTYFDGFISDAAAGVLYQAVTLNVADAATDVEPLLTSNATVLSKAALRGFNYIKATIEAGAAGNDATDPNAMYLTWQIFGTKE